MRGPNKPIEIEPTIYKLLYKRASRPSGPGHDLRIIKVTSLFIFFAAVVYFSHQNVNVKKQPEKYKIRNFNFKAKS